MNPIAVHWSVWHLGNEPASFLVSSSGNREAHVTRGISGTTRSMNTSTVRDRAATTLHAFGIGTSPGWEA